MLSASVLNLTTLPSDVKPVTTVRSSQDHVQVTLSVVLAFTHAELGIATTSATRRRRARRGVLERAQ